MKKFFSLLMVAGLINTVQARQIKINLAMPMEETCMQWQCDDLRMEVTAMPCDESCMVQMEIAVYEMMPEGERMMCKPCMRTEWEKPACMCMTSNDESPMVESIEIVAECCKADESAMKVEVTK